MYWTRKHYQKIRMHSSRMRTACSLTISCHILCMLPHNHAPPTTMHAPNNHAHPNTTTHQPCNHTHPLNNHAPPATTHASQQPHMPPSNHTCPPATTHAPQQPCMPPATTHAPWQPCTSPTTMHPPSNHAHPPATMHAPWAPCMPPSLCTTRFWKYCLAPAPASLRAVKIRDLTRNWTQVDCLTVIHFNHYTRMFSVHSCSKLQQRQGFWQKFCG